MTAHSHLVYREMSVPPGTNQELPLAGWYFLRVEQGEGCIIQPTPPQLLGEGCVLVKNPGTACLIRASQVGALRIHFFQVQAELLSGILSCHERQQLDETIGDKDPHPLHLFAPDSQFADRFAAIVRLAPTASQLLIRCELLNMAAMIFTDHLTAQPAPQPGVLTAQERFKNLLRIMPEAELENRSAEDLAKLCGCSVRHFSRLFRRYFGSSLVPKRTELCLQKARRMIEQTDGKIIDVAMDSGFNHVGLFTTRFKERFGMTPSEWRKRSGRAAKPPKGKTPRVTFQRVAEATR